MKKNIFKKILPVILLVAVIMPNVCLAADLGENIRDTLTGFNTVLGLPSGVSDPVKLVTNIVSAVLGLLGLVCIVLIIYGGFIWMTAGGDSGKVKNAQDIIRNALIGVVIVLLAYVITRVVVDVIINIGEGKEDIF